MIREKGIAEYVEAARAVRAVHPGARFVMAGEIGVDNPSAIPASTIEAWQDEGIVEYAGFSSDIREQIREADCVVLPSYYREGVPRTLLEAASMGRPLITTDNVGCREAVDDGSNGYLCRPRDAGDLAAAMLRFLALPPSERARMGEASRRKVLAEFDEAIVIRSYRAGGRGGSRALSPAAPRCRRSRRRRATVSCTIGGTMLSWMALGINWLAVAACGLGTIVVGFLWYGPLFGGPWGRLTGWTDDKVREVSRGRMVLTFAGTIVAGLVMMSVLAMVLRLAAMATVADSLILAGLVWLGFTAATTASSFLFERRPLALWLIEEGYYLVTLLLGSVVLALWP